MLDRPRGILKTAGVVTNLKSLEQTNGSRRRYAGTRKPARGNSNYEHKGVLAEENYNLILLNSGEGVSSLGGIRDRKESRRPREVSSSFRRGIEKATKSFKNRNTNCMKTEKPCSERTHRGVEASRSMKKTVYHQEMAEPKGLVRVLGKGNHHLGTRAPDVIGLKAVETGCKLHDRRGTRYRSGRLSKTR